MAKVKNDVLAAFLSADLNVTKPVHIKRLGVDLEVKAIDGKTINRIQEQATHGKTLDEQKFGSLIIAKACVNLDFGDAGMLEKYEASDSSDCVQKALLAGEIAKITQSIMEISGFDDFDKQVADAKN
jgi:hypothetical protein